MSTLYRKYRPQNFLEVVGQNHIKLILEQEIKTNKIAHAYLFCGPRAVGKTTLARVFAKAINCKERKVETADPCNKCFSCEEITVGRALDVIEIDAASHTGVDNVRENIIASARVVSSKAKYKVFIIDEVHMLSISAFNALLKIIEEPPTFVVFILCTTEVHKVPSTIISRCQRFDFGRISVSDVVKKLNYIIKAEELKIDKSILEEIARHSEGYMRDAESLLGQIVAISGKEITSEEASLVIPRSNLSEVINLINFLVKKDAGSGIRLINKLIDNGVDLKSFLNDLIEILRKLMLGKISSGLMEKLAIELGESMELKINQLSQEMTLDQLLIYLEKFIKVKNELKGDFIQQLSTELAIAELSITPIVRTTPLLNQISHGSRVIQQDQRKDLPIKPVVSTVEEKIDSELIIQTNSSSNVSHEQIVDRWNEVLIKIKQNNLSLSFILNVCQPVSFNNNKLCLAFKYKFHRDRVSENNIKVLVEEVLCQTFGVPIIIEAIVDENLEVTVNKIISEGPLNSEKEPEVILGLGEQGSMIDNLLKTFGGKVVGQ
ncbi:DNA polymerase III subunit gamma/tau [Patescibacteria group bacterium]|nr:DNA polymerase III subunit gamma/tau [Patescibacteria group bacterium]MBU0879666.1 DNA polymerase III subunit gamma/tau [Patescibacteria group bacterium]MBU0880371.1 DNA polymerase III subunit gamma/tau [Patescibacteria group bacterium]MBU0898121.1 DNA polymerase III subunit gamma/tau [Patescibacteria group bacterium]MBU1782979.1 DNA polymerase III subunit gamma/tau [Patescibacteria group bacterium]